MGHGKVLHMLDCMLMAIYRRREGQGTSSDFVFLAYLKSGADLVVCESWMK